MTEIIKNNNAMAFDLLEVGSPEQVNSENGEFFSSIFSDKEITYKESIKAEGLNSSEAKSLEKNIVEIMSLIQESELDIPNEILDKIESSIKKFFQMFLAEDNKKLGSVTENEESNFLNLMKFLDDIKEMMAYKQDSTKSREKAIDIILDKIRTNLNSKIKNFYKSYSNVLENKNEVLLNNQSEQDSHTQKNSSNISNSNKLTNILGTNTLSNGVGVKLSTQDIDNQTGANKKKLKTKSNSDLSGSTKSEFKSTSHLDTKAFEGKIDFTNLQTKPINLNFKDSVADKSLLTQSTSHIIKSDVDQNSYEGNNQRPANLSKEPSHRLLDNLNMLSKNWGEKLIDKIEKSIVDGMEKLEISLTPKSLGRLNITINLQDNLAKINIVAETASAAALLGEAEAKLAQMMETSGLKLASLQALTQQFNGNNRDKGQTSKLASNKKRNDVEQPNIIEVSSKKTSQKEGLNLIA